MNIRELVGLINFSHNRNLSALADLAGNAIAELTRTLRDVEPKDFTVIGERTALSGNVMIHNHEEKVIFDLAEYKSLCKFAERDFELEIIEGEFTHNDKVMLAFYLKQLIICENDSEHRKVLLESYTEVVTELAKWEAAA